MSNSSKTKEQTKTKNTSELADKITQKLIARGVGDPKLATDEQMYHAVVSAVKDILIENRENFTKLAKQTSSKRVCYLCMEFLVGRSLKNNLMNMGLYDEVCDFLSKSGTSFDKIYACEVDPGLGNGGLGRLAACFMDSLTAKDYFANGYSLLYENGLFKQKIIDGEQVELPDDWIAGGGAWLVPHPEKSISVRFGGKIEESWASGECKITHTEYDEVKAVPYDLLIPGTVTNATNSIRLWRARQPYSGINGYDISQSSYVQRLNEADSVEVITKQLYPPDDHDEGKLLRLTQQYFLVSASLQSIIRDYFTSKGSLEGFEDNIAIHINDTHPALCIPELMRIFMDVYSFSWEDAWRIVTKCVTYTNHTVLPEALECWRVDLFSMKLPRIYNIVLEINRRFTTDLWNLYPGDWDRISRMSIVAYNQVRMANMSVVASHTVNGVSKLHSEILKKTIFHDFYKMQPEKFTNVTNGVVHRRWLNYANPGLCSLISDLIGNDFREDAGKLSELNAYKDDKTVLSRVAEIKLANKVNFANYVHEKTGRVIDPRSVFDVQIKRMHEYKRQLLNVLKIMSLYQDILDNPNVDIPPQTFIFGCKAAPGYAMAKKIIKLIWFLSEELERNPLTKDRLRIVFMEDYNVSLAEKLIPSADISEQISLAGKEASGTGCMKLMMNGALTIGTLDGANVEILDAVGADNMYVFGLNTPEVEELWRNGYVAREYYHASESLRKVIDRFSMPIGGQNFSHIADYLVNGGYGIADPFMCLADFESYTNVYHTAMKDYQKPLDWARKSFLNTANSGIFSSDNSVTHYAKEIWHMEPVRKK